MKEKVPLEITIYTLGSDKPWQYVRYYFIKHYWYKSLDVHKTYIVVLVYV